MNFSNCKKAILIALFAGYACASTSFAALDSKFNRNGEVYLSVSGLADTSKNGIHRLNNPENQSGIIVPNRIIDRTKIKSFSVNIERIIYTLCDPIETEVGQNYKIYRQVLDGSTALKPLNDSASTWTEPGSVGVANPDKYDFNMYEGFADWGDWDYPHTDSRNNVFKGNNQKYRSTYGAGTLIYRTTTDPTHDDSNTAVSSGGTRRKLYRMSTKDSGYYNMTRSNASLSSVYATQGKKIGKTLPDGKTYKDVLPYFGDYKRYLPYYQDKDWYEIPNGAWFSSWRFFYGRGYSYQPKIPNDKSYGQAYCDLYVGTEFDWKMTTDGPNGSDYNNYKQQTAKRIIKTSKVNILRGIICNCLDSCGVSTGPVGETEAYDPLFSAAFMPVGTGNDVRVYTYQRVDDNKSDGYTNAGDFPSLVLGNKNGIGKYDTKWIGVSKGKVKDYVYLLGTSQIQNWIGDKLTLSNKGIQSVSVSNQWNEQGGIIFAFDPGLKLIIKFTLNDDGTRKDYTTIDISNLMSKFQSDKSVSVDDIAADGFGNLYVSFTEPSSNKNYNVPQKQKWNFSKAKSCELDSTNGDGNKIYKYTFIVNYSKSVWKVSNNGQNPEKIGEVVIAQRKYFRTVVVKPEDAALISTGSPSQWNSNINSLIKQNKIDKNVDISGFVAEPMDIPVADSKVAVINSPTPPKMFSLYGKSSYLDIIGPYDSFVVPDYLNYATGQSKPTISNTNLGKGKLYYFYAENYPIDGDIKQDPKTNPDYDGDKKLGGFLSTVIDSKICYNWNVWNVSEYYQPEDGDPNAGKVVPCYYSDESNIPEIYSDSYDNTPYVTLYSPYAAKYIITCVATYSYYDYDSVKFGESYSTWINSDKAIQRGIASPSAPCTNTNHSVDMCPQAYSDCSADAVKARLKSALQKLFSGVKGVDAKLDKIAKYIYDNSGAYKNFMAIEIASVPGTGAPPPTDVSNLAQIERSNNLPNKNTSWYTSDKLTPSKEYHGVYASRDTYWRIDIDEMGMFFTNNLKDKNSQGKTYYDVIKERLLREPTSTNPNPFYVYSHEVEGQPESRYLLFEGNGNDIKWKDDLNFKDDENTLAQIATKLFRSVKVGNKEFTEKDGIEIKIIKNAAEKYYLYVKIPGNKFQPTDPKEENIEITINRELLYYCSQVRDRILDPSVTYSPLLKMRIPYTLVGQAKVIFIDDLPPTIAWKKITPNQINGQTGEKLGNQKISITYSDENPNEQYTNLASHKDWAATNTSTNLQNKDKANGNLLPVYSTSNRCARVSMFIPGRGTNTPYLNDVDKNEYVKYYGTRSVIEYNIDKYSDGKPVNSDVSVNLDSGSFTIVKSTPTQTGGVYNTIEVLPSDIYSDKLAYNYANNTPNYEPGSFTVIISDASGNIAKRSITSDSKYKDSRKYTPYFLNVLLEIEDTIRPVPYGVIQIPSRNNVSTSFPARKQALYALAKIASATPEVMANSVEAPTVLSLYGPDNQETWTATTTSGVEGMLTAHKGHMGYTYWALPQPSANITSGVTIDQTTKKRKTTSNYNLIKTLISQSIPPVIANLQDNTEIIIKATGLDNCGTTETILSFRYIDESGNELATTSSKVSNGVDIANSNYTIKRTIFRESENIKLPYIVPITITVTDDSLKPRTWTPTYTNDEFTGNWTVSAAVNRNLQDRRRILKTSIPVTGSQMDIRTLEKYTNTNKNTNKK